MWGDLLTGLLVLVALLVGALVSAWFTRKTGFDMFTGLPSDDVGQLCDDIDSSGTSHRKTPEEVEQMLAAARAEAHAHWREQDRKKAEARRMLDLRYKKRKKRRAGQHQPKPGTRRG